MKTVLLVVMGMLCSLAHAQTTAEKAFEDAIELYNAEKYSEALLAFEGFMKEFPQHELKPRAHYNLAFTYKSMGDLPNAKVIFNNILEQDYNDRDENSLMEPYALYKHHASRNLASIAIEEKNFEDAEKYIRFFDKKYPYQHFCGNEWAAYDMFKAVMEAKVYEGKGKPDLAIKSLAPHLFYNGLAANNEVLREISRILESHFAPDKVRNIFADALNSIRVQTKKGEGEAILTFFEVEVPILPYGFDFADTRSPDIEAYKKMLRTHELFLKFL